MVASVISASTPFQSHAEMEKAKQSKAIAKWRAFLLEVYPPRAGEGVFVWQFEANMMGGPHALHQVPAAAREEVLQAAYEVAADPSGLTLDRTRCDFISLEKYKLCKRIDPDIQWPMHGGLMLAFIQWRKQNTTSAKGGYSIAASIKSSFCKAARQLGTRPAGVAPQKVVLRERHLF